MNTDDSEYDKLSNPETFNADPVYIFDLEMVPSPPGTRAAERPSDRPRIAGEPSKHSLQELLFIFDDRIDTPPPT